MLQIPISARVQALEGGVPQQQERLGGHLEGKAAALAGEHAPLLTRVEALERAMAALLKAQVGPSLQAVWSAGHVDLANMHCSDSVLRFNCRARHWHLHGAQHRSKALLPAGTWLTFLS